MIDISLILSKLLSAAARLIPDRPIRLSNGGTLLRISRDRWVYNRDGMCIRFTTEILIGPMDYIIYEQSMRYGPNYEIEVETKNRKEVVNAFVEHMNKSGKRVVVE